MSVTLINMVSILISLGLKFKDSSKFVEALGYIQEALLIMKCIHVRKSPRTAFRFYLLGIVLCNQNRLQESLKAHRKSLLYQLAWEGADWDSTLVGMKDGMRVSHRLGVGESMHEVAHILSKLGQFDDALDMLKKTQLGDDDEFVKTIRETILEAQRVSGFDQSSISDTVAEVKPTN